MRMLRARELRWQGDTFISIWNLRNRQPTYRIRRGPGIKSDSAKDNGNFSFKLNTQRAARFEFMSECVIEFSRRVTRRHFFFSFFFSTLLFLVLFLSSSSSFSSSFSSSYHRNDTFSLYIYNTTRRGIRDGRTVNNVTSIDKISRSINISHHIQEKELLNHESETAMSRSQ